MFRDQSDASSRLFMLSGFFGKHSLVFDKALPE